MSSKKKVRKSEVETTTLPPNRVKYWLLSPDSWHSCAVYGDGKVLITHNEHSYLQVIDTKNGYQVTDVSPLGGTKVYNIDYAAMADLFAALKIFYHNADKKNGEYWTIFQGEKI